MIRWCARCVLPSSRPNLELGPDGVCNACASHASRREIDWKARGKAFSEVASNARRRAKGYDCLIPVSGGKDSTWQVATCLERGLTPLAVTWRTPARTELGERNLANLKELGIDHVDFQVNPKVERKFMLKALERHGSTAIPMHMALFSIPLQLAVRYEIPLVVWGENSAFEYGGDEEERTGFKLDGRWLKKYGVTHGTCAADWIGPDLTAKEMLPYFSPTERELEAKGVLAVFLGYYFPWDPETSLAVARRNGFQARAEGPKTGYYDYADIDDDFISIHHFLKWYKFGFTRLYDNLSLEIRNGRMTREQAVALIRRRGDETPHQDIDRFCRFVGIDKAGFFELTERFRNPKVWTRRNGRWMIDGFLIPDWSWS